VSGSQEVKRLIRDAPDLFGVYLFKDVEGSVLYVGKALSLRKRLSGYMTAFSEESRGSVPIKTWEMAQKAVDLEWIVTSGEVEALFLEHNLIQEYRPPFNVLLRDDKSYPFVVVTLEDPFPRVMLTRQSHRKGNRYFGPYGRAGKARGTLDTLGRVFPFRKCRGRVPGRRGGTPCLQYHLGRCLAPCEGKVSKEEYAEIIGSVISFLDGRVADLEEGLEQAMTAAAEAQDYERAVVYRDRLDSVRHVQARQQVRCASIGTADVIGLATAGNGANVQIFQTRDGVVADRRSFSLVNVEGADEGEVLERLIGTYYSSSPTVPPEVVVPRFVKDTERLAGFLQMLRGHPVTVRRAERGDRRRLVELAEHNAELSLEHQTRREERSRERRLEAMEELQDIVGAESAPFRIEGYDISNLGPEGVVGAMVVFLGGRPEKNYYRRFSIRSVEGQDDVGSMKEVLARRLQRFGGANAPGPEEDLAFSGRPDLIMVDGGKGQLGAALLALEGSSLTGKVPVVALAKREEEIYLPGRPTPLQLGRESPGLALLQAVRDEAHRFAVSYQRKRRQTGTTESFLDGLPGVGGRRKKAILAHFGSPDRFMTATREEMEAVPGLPGKVARRLYEHLHKTG